MTMVSMSGRARIGLTGAILALAVTGCATPAAVPSQPTPAATLPRPLGMSDPAKPPTAASGTDTSCDPYASLTPSSLPAPGNMPSGSTMAKILKRGRLIVGVDQNTYLFGYRDPATGDDRRLRHRHRPRGRAAPSSATRTRCSSSPSPSAQRIPYVQNGTVDLVADTMTINCARWQQVDFSSIYYDAGQRVLVPSDSKADRHRRPRRPESLRRRRQHLDLEHRGRDVQADPGRPSTTGPTAWCCCSRTRSPRSPPTTRSCAGLAAQDPQTKLVGAAFTAEPYGMAIAEVEPRPGPVRQRVLEKMRTRTAGGPPSTASGSARTAYPARHA